MKTAARFLFLGTGGSLGIPVIGCKCAVCTSASPYNHRLRSSGLIEWEGKRLLLDCGPDFRRQALTYGIDSLDAVLLTHAHHDHTAGVDELRIFSFNAQDSLPCFLSKETYQDLLRRFYYIFTENPHEKAYYTAHFQCRFLEGRTGFFECEGLKIRYCSYFQAGMKVNGFRLGDFAYFSDVKDYDDSLFLELKGVKTLVISALRFTASPLHLSVDEAVGFIKRSGVERAWLTHIAHELDYEQANSHLPENIRIAYDGLTISFIPERFSL